MTGLGGGVPTGCILIWSGAANAIPTGYALCDGNNSTPDLRDRFVVGAGNSYSVGATGGANTVTLSVNEIPSHTHVIDTHGSQGSGGFSAIGHGRSTGNQSSSDASGVANTGGGAAHENRPPYYALCYIMKT